MCALACGPNVEDESDPSSSSSETGSPCGAVAPAVAEDLLHPYGPCTHPCLVGEQSYCPSFGDLVPPVDLACREGRYIVCAWNCTTVDDCPPPPSEHPVACQYGSCFYRCPDGDCPEGMTCVPFGDPEFGVPFEAVCVYWDPED